MKTAKFNDAIVIEADTPSHRWLDIFGECQKYSLDNGFPTDDSSGDPTQFVSTVVEDGTGTSKVENAVTRGVSMLITTAANEYDGVNLQLKGEAFKLTANKPLYFGVKLKVSDATESDLLVGLAETDTALLSVATDHEADYGTSDVLGFLKVDSDKTVSTQSVVAGTVKSTADYDTDMVDDTFVTLEIYWDGSTVFFYGDGDLITSTNSSLPDGDLTPTINFRAGAGAAKTCSVAWLRCFQAN